MLLKSFFNVIIRKRTISVLTIVEALIYLVLIAGCVLLFNTWNDIPTRVVSFEIDKLYPNLKEENIIVNDTTYRLTEADVVCRIPMKKLTEKEAAQNVYSWKAVEKSSTYKAIICHGMKYETQWSDSIDKRLEEIRENVWNKCLIPKDSVGMILFFEMKIHSNDSYWGNVFKKDVFNNHKDKDISTYAKIQPRINSTIVNQTVFVENNKKNFGSVSIEHNSEAIVSPGWLHMADISSSYYEFNINSQTLVDVSKLEIDFVSIVDFNSPTIVPDSITYHSIIYTEKDKLKKITESGLRFFAEFPEMRNKQNVRVFGLSALLSAFVGFLISILIGFVLGSQIDKKK